MHTKVRNSRIYIKRIDRQTAKELSGWGSFDDPRLIGYNYGNLTDFEMNFWYSTITSPRKKYFAVKRYEDDRFIGFMGLKNYNPITRKAKLGIVFDPNFVSKGYGSEALSEFLDYYFNSLNFKELSLEVNLFNDRALALYEKLGFREVGFGTELFENQKIEFDDRFFEYKKGMIYSKIIKMKLTKDDFNGL